MVGGDGLDGGCVGGIKVEYEGRDDEDEVIVDGELFVVGVVGKVWSCDFGRDG